MIAADVTRALLLVSILVTSAFNMLTIWQVYAVLFLFGIGTIVFDVANVSYLPSLVGRNQVLSANSRIVASTSIAGQLGRDWPALSSSSSRHRSPSLWMPAPSFYPPP
jgi:hypothetical protein